MQLELGPQGTAIMPVRPSRSPVLRGETREKVTGCGSLYVTVNEDDFGPREIFANMGKAGGCASASTEAIGRLISLAFRYGVPPDKIVKQLGASAAMCRWDSVPTRSCPAPTPSAKPWPTSTT